MGAVQVRDTDHRVIGEFLKRLEVQALVVHLNPGQEIFQQKGDRDFRGLTDTLLRLAEVAPVPLIVKETGFGMRPSLINYLLDRGVAYVDLAGAGGTNWVAVESYFLSNDDFEIAREFDGWGIPTAVLLDALGEREDRILASGGIRSGLDVAKSIALGASLAGTALPLIRAFNAGGVDEVLEVINRMEKVFKVVMMLTGSKDLSALRRVPLWRNDSFARSVEALKAAEAEDVY
jgi:isopentenyl-diphosphate delta-isomerase type 2